MQQNSIEGAPPLQLQETFTGGAPENPEEPEGSAMPGLGPFHRTDAGLLPVRLEGLRFSELGEHVLRSLQNFQWKRSSKAMTTAKDFLFPLPLGGCYHVQPEMQPWLTAVLRGLNSMYGSGQTNNQVPTALQKRVAQTVMGFLQRCFLWQEVVPQISFEDLFRVKGVDYRGEEIKLARSLNWPAPLTGSLLQLHFLMKWVLWQSKTSARGDVYLILMILSVFCGPRISNIWAVCRVRWWPTWTGRRSARDW